MAQRIINIGTGPNTKDGDTVRQAFNLTNQNFTEVYTLLGLATGEYSDRLVNGNAQVVLAVGVGNNPYVTFPEFEGGQIQIQSSEISATSGIAVLSSFDSAVQIRPNSGNSYINWSFEPDGRTIIPNSITSYNTTVQIAQAECLPGTPTVIYTARSDIAGLKMIVFIEGYVNGDSTGPHTQTCEVILAARGALMSGQPAVTVYGIVHTSPTPLATITAQRNLTTGAIEVIATETSGLPGTNLSVRSRVIDTITRLEI